MSKRPGERGNGDKGGSEAGYYRNLLVGWSEGTGRMNRSCLLGLVGMNILLKLQAP